MSVKAARGEPIQNKLTSSYPTRSCLNCLRHQQGYELENIAPSANYCYSNPYSWFHSDQTAKPIFKDQCCDYAATALARSIAQQALFLTGVFNGDASADDLDSYKRFDKLMLAKPNCRGFHERNTSSNKRSVP
jgi:hypothetical protein